MVVMTAVTSMSPVASAAFMAAMVLVVMLLVRGRITVLLML